MTRRRASVLVAAAGFVIACGAPAEASPSGSPVSAEVVTAAPTGAPGPTPAPVQTPAPTPDAAPALVVTCDGAAVLRSAPAVRARPDGVHIEFVLGSGSPATVTVQAAGAEDHVTMDGAAPRALAPGHYRLTCHGPSGEDGAQGEVLVTDPDHLWRPGGIACEGGSGVVGGGAGDGDPAAPAEAIALVRSIVLNLRPDDVLEAAGYPDAPSGWINLVRDGRVAAAWRVTGTGSSLSVGVMEHCPDAAIRYAESD